MTVEELRDVLKKFPNSMTVVLGVDESLEDICASSIEVVKIQYTDGEEGFDTLLVLPVCNCEDDSLEIVDEIINPELN